jgi:hypothetical protein
MEMVSASRGRAWGYTAPSLTALVGTINQTSNVDLGKLSQGE